MKRFWPKLAVKSYDLEVHKKYAHSPVRRVVIKVFLFQKISDTGRHLTNIAISEEREQPDYRDFVKQFENEATLLGQRNQHFS